MQFRNSYLVTCTSAVLLIFMTGCAGYMTASRPARSLFFSSKFDQSAIEFEKQIEDSGKDRLLALMDTALAYHYAGQYELSNKYFLEADKLAEELDTISLSRQTASLIATDYMLKYSGDDFEKVLINSYLALNYLFLGDIENAMVEVRRINNKLAKYERKCECKYGINPFAVYLSGLLYEMEGQWDDAYIDYKKAYELMPDFPLLPADLVRLACRLHRDEDCERWKNKFGLPVPQADSDEGELVVIFEAGLSPQKRQETRVIAIPAYHPRPSRIKSARVVVDDKSLGRTQVLNDIEQIATYQLKEKMGRMLVKQGLVTGTKIAAANAIRQQTRSSAAGDLALMFFYATNEADTRSWLTLPQNIQLQRTPLPEGKYHVSLKLLDSFGQVVQIADMGEVAIPPRGKKFVSFRSVQ